MSLQSAGHGARGMTGGESPLNSPSRGDTTPTKATNVFTEVFDDHSEPSEKGATRVLYHFNHLLEFIPGVIWFSVISEEGLC